MDTRSIIIWVVIGLIAGWLASFVVGGGGLLKYILWGLVGSFVGGFLARQFNISLNIGNAFVEQIIVATVGAIIVVLIARLIS
ncbi:GlsB/YeaQ/YmgE family stress response membrane protein [Rhodobium gokarnense]|uniref:Membrane protein YeaQ/YmgE (Transglycosylase-associated protein family) n=1 Tax=Rhodobium gokarnense TaxID=364296 RepID=A0ABT3HB30_9HYPH|nr:GlsB/YeaQ/YmgE family stress response membrane protein [Rhodobium gokarnense]MCW2307592.1 putative membrane protein YeaQ/YmgE (transglycosylase-associated protein family) [Rhodobium gokarnense]